MTPNLALYDPAFVGAAGAAGGGLGGWKELDRVTLGASNEYITITGLPAKDYYNVLSYTIPKNVEINPANRFGSSGTIDSSATYSRRRNVGYASDSTAGSQDNISNNSTSSNCFQSCAIMNIASAEHMCINETVAPNAAGAANAPTNCQCMGKWADTNTLDSVQLYAAQGGADEYDIGSEMVVLGYDGADADEGGFWEELANVDLSGGTATSLSTGTMTAKKYLMYAALTGADLSGASVGFQFNGVTTSTYAWLGEENGGGTTGTSQNQTRIGMDHHSSNCFRIGYLINIDGQEKTGFSYAIKGTAAGAASAPSRGEYTQKAEQSSQITSIELVAEGSTLGTTSKLVVWGAD